MTCSLNIILAVVDDELLKGKQSLSVVLFDLLNYVGIVAASPSVACC